MKVTLDKVFKSVKETKFGEKLSVGIKIKEATVHDINGDEVTVGDRYINAWMPKDAQFNYEAGQVINIQVKQRGDYLDFKMVDGQQPSTPSTSGLEERVKRLEEAVFKDEPVDSEPETAPDPDDF